jgi:hypothetical protein
MTTEEVERWSSVVASRYLEGWLVVANQYLEGWLVVLSRRCDRSINLWEMRIVGD